MPESQRELAMTRVAFLELKDEQRLVQEGYALLDEKRIVLAAEIRRQLLRLRNLRARSREARQSAYHCLMAALNCHGLEELEVYPPLSTANDRLDIRHSRLLGLELIEARLEAAAARTGLRAVNPSPEARACALAHRNWLVIAVELAACCLNLRRLVREYIRTERRARAIENILLPEIVSGLALIDEQLESMDQEELARLRTRYAGRGFD